jgi:hypothetical protein
VNDAGVNVTFGTEGAVTLMGPEKPFRPAAETETLPEVPAASPRSAGETPSEKSGGGAMTTVRPADRLPVMPEAVPAKAAARLPGEAAAEAATVTARVEPGVSVNEDGVKVTSGSAGAVTVMVPENPFSPVAWTVVVAEPPGRSVSVEGEAEREKSGAAVTVTVTGRVCDGPDEGVKVAVSG